MSKKLVAYFSASGTTQTSAKKIASLLNCDTYEIKPKNPPMQQKISIGMIQILEQLSNVKIEIADQN